MTTSEIQKLLEYITIVVNGNGSYAEKREKILDNATDDDKTALFEFVSWFPED